MTSHTSRLHARLVATTILTTTLLGGCMSVPVLSGPPAPKGAQKSLTELREQAAAFTNATIDATGIPDGWYAGDKSYGGSGIPWGTTDRSDEYPPEKCGMGGDLRTAPHRIEVIINNDYGGDPRPLAKKVTDEWEKQGFTVRTVIPYRTHSDGGYFLEIRGDAEDGRFVGFSGSHFMMSIDSFSECSTHPTVLEEVSNLIDNFSFDIPEFEDDDEPATETPRPEPRL
jgi:hypothetical protein